MTQPVDDGMDGVDVATASIPRRGRLIVAAFVAALLLLVGGIVIGRVTSPNPELTPTTTSAEAGFARDMQTHHQQAVEMAMIIYGKTVDPDIKLLAYDIATAQAQQAGQMYGWLESWGLPQSAPEPSMTWMTRPALDGSGSSHEHGESTSAHTAGDPMPGYATTAQIDELEVATGTEADQLFLTFMIAHHQGGIEMADALLERSTNDVVTSLATSVVFAQQGEITYMQGLLTP